MQGTLTSEITLRYKARGAHKLSHLDKHLAENIIHGHDYLIEVVLAGEIDSRTGLVVKRDIVDEVVQELLIGPYDKSYLNEHFKFTTGEALANEFYTILKKSRISNLLKQVNIQETAKNYFSTVI